MKKLNLKGVTIQTWVRTIVLALALISQILVLAGKTDKLIDEEKATEALTLLFTIIASVWGFWKNNSFTDKAQEADAVLNDDGTNEILIESEMTDDE